MTDTLLITVFTEGLIVFAYCRRSGKPLLPILLTSVAANLLTQSLLWMVLMIFFQQYILTLLATEILIWFLESLFLSLPPQSQLTIRNALFLSLLMNGVSFGIGWFLSV